MMGDINDIACSSPELSAKRLGRRKRSRFQLKDNIELFILTLPALIVVFIWQYLPMGGAIIAFKQYNYVDGIFGSPWAGLGNFEFFFKSQDLWRLIRNTVSYSVAFIVTDIVVAVIVALLMYELRNRALIKFYQTAYILPRFLSWVIVGYISYIFLNPIYGYFNQALEALGMNSVDWYSQLAYWPPFLILINIWKHVGMNAIIYYSFLMNVNRELYDAAMIDGARRMQQARYISLPSLAPLISILAIMAMGRVFRGDFGLFYQIPRNVGVLYPVTDVIDTYVYRGLKDGNFAITAAVGLFQSVVGFILVLGSNFAVRKIDPEKSMF